eukprot:TRINITY_DN60108_c0_g1_i1.p1 TRINITY_DN60108_c0_g1~~TRINITY_DN60108_c0_g1_i1.p1  ORF type:complete len:244 (-),score=58.69 TRINITY_DN60108_c0_g1_i1:19-750(-)
MSADDLDPDIEYTLLNKKDAKVYQVPPAASAEGHKAGDWKEAIWHGNVRVIGKGKDLSIRLMNNGTGELFAQCVIPNGEYEKYCERVLDSSRYWVLKIVNGHRHAFIGFGFSDRNDAFDFSACLTDFKATFVDKAREAEAAVVQPMRDLSLKEGQTIKVNIPGRQSGSRRQDRSSGSSAGYAPTLAAPPAASALLLAPPAPAASAVLQGQLPAKPVGKASAPAPQDDFADFADFQSAAVPPSV